MEKVITSKQFSLKFRDFLKGAFLAILTSVSIAVQQSLDKGELSFNWKYIGMTAVGTFISYLLKNYLDKPKVVVTTQTNDDAEALKKNLE